MKIVITGSSGLIGSAVCRHFGSKGHEIIGIDNNQRAVFFGKEADTSWNRQKLEQDLSTYKHHCIDIRDREAVLSLIEDIRPNAIVHTAAQPSHDRAADIPFEDFETNAMGTHNLLEACRRHCPTSPFVFMSTNKVYGDKPNTIRLKETPTRFEYDDEIYTNGINEEFGIDQSKHSLFGASKAAADIMVQEYGRYFGIPCCCLRGGCLTGPAHSGVQLHGFLSFLIKCNLEEKEYRIFGYKGKQVRDNIHAYDVASFIEHFIAHPRCAEVYNIGGGKANSCSIWEAFDLVKKYTGKSQLYTYEEQNRIGDHICYYSDLSKMRAHYPQWQLSYSLEDTIREIIFEWRKRMSESQTKVVA